MSKEPENNNEELILYKVDEINKTFMQKLKKEIKESNFFSCNMADAKLTVLLGLPAAGLFGSYNGGVAAALGIVALTGVALQAAKLSVRLIGAASGVAMEILSDKYADEMGKKTLSNKDLKIDIKEAIKIRQSATKNTFIDDDKFKELEKKYGMNKINKSGNERSRAGRVVAIDHSIRTIRGLGR